MKLKTVKILENKLLSKDTFLLKLQVSNFRKIFPTQFVLVDTYPYRFLFKPFSVVEYKNNVLYLLYRVISDGTRYLSSLKQTSSLTLLGPFGNYKKVTRLKIKPQDYILLVAGGSGIASIISLYKHLLTFTRNINIFYGERSKDYIIELKHFGIRNVIYTTEDGSYGSKGTVVDIFAKEILKKELPDYIFVCGPKIMLKRFKELTNNNFYQTKIFALLEEYMCCGTGLCRSCVVRIKYNNEIKLAAVCKDGPMFELKTVIL